MSTSYKPTVLVTAPVGTRSGYGSRSRDVVRALIATDKYDIHIQPVPWGSTPQNALVADDPKDKQIISLIKPMEKQPDVHIHIVVPNEFTPVGKYNIGITAGLETTIIPQSWVEGCNRMNLVLCSSKFTRDVIAGTVFTNNETNQKLKVTTKCDVLFEGADLETYFPTNECSKVLASEMEKVKEDWNFLFVGHWLQGNLGQDRKDVGMLVKSFLESFKGSDGVGLIMKTSGATPSTMDIDDLHRKVFEIKNNCSNTDLPNIYILHADLFDSEMNDLYNHPKVKAHVTFTHGEGFGRPLLEASLSEKPILAPRFSGHVDFLSGKQQTWLPGGLTEVQEGSFPPNMYLKGQQWWTVNYGAAISAMKNLKMNYRKSKLWAKKLATTNRNKFSFTAMVKSLDSILDSNLPQFTQTVGMNLPKLNLPTLEKVEK